MDMMEQQYGIDFEWEFDQSAKLRFMEMEISNFIQQLKQRFGAYRGREIAVNLFQMVSDLDVNEIIEAIESLERHVAKPSKKEYVIFLIFYKQMSQYKAKKIAGNSPNFINDVRKEFIDNPYQPTPIFMDQTIKLYDAFGQISLLFSINDSINH